MRSGTVGLTVFLALAAPFFPGRARACSIAAPQRHTIDPAQVGVDQTPPQLAQPTVAELHKNDTGGGCLNNKCGADHSAKLTNLATDDMTPVNRIGYRVTLVAGEAAYFGTGLSIPALGEADGSLWLTWDGDDDFDLTAQLIAIDAAGNESAPATVHLSSGGGCSIGHRRASNGFALAILALALAIAAARPLRRRR